MIADDLTGACDVAAALVPWPEPVLVSVSRGDGAAPAGLPVRNTASRTLPPASAAAAVHAALADVPQGWRGILVKKIDTALRGPLGAELDAAIDAVGASEAFVVPAIPEVGRTTRDGVQHADGVPVDRTAFARDPGNPVRDARVGAVVETTSRRRAGVVGLADVRAGGIAAAVERLRREGATIVVCDAETDDDLGRVVAAVLERPRPLVLAGSTGLARTLRTALGVTTDRPPLDVAPACDAGVLVVVGSLHPVARAQVAALGDRARVAVVERDHAGPGHAAATWLAAGDTAVLTTPPVAGDGARIAASLAAAACAALERTRPGALVLVGGESAQAVLAALGVEWLAIDDAPAPLAVRGRIAGGGLAGLRVVTKGGSTGPPDRLRRLVEGVT